MFTIILVFIAVVFFTDVFFKYAQKALDFRKEALDQQIAQLKEQNRLLNEALVKIEAFKHH